jgi:DNA-binding MarR family transcriptional regulator
MDKCNEFTLQDFFPYQVRIYYLAVSGAINGIYSDKYGLKTDEWRILLNLYTTSPMTAKEMAEKASIGYVNVSRAISSLEKRKYIDKFVNANDRRSVLVRMTQKGRRAIQDIIPVLKQKEEDFLSDLTVDEQKMLIKLMSKVRRKIQQSEQTDLDI